MYLDLLYNSMEEDTYGGRVVEKKTNTLLNTLKGEVGVLVEG